MSEFFEDQMRRVEAAMREAERSDLDRLFMLSYSAHVIAPRPMVYAELCDDAIDCGAAVDALVMVVRAAVAAWANHRELIERFARATAVAVIAGLATHIELGGARHVADELEPDVLPIEVD